MKKYLIKILFIIVFGLFLVPCLLAKTVVPTLQRASLSVRPAPGSNAQANGSGEQTQQSPLDEPFSVKHPYKNTGVSANVVALDMTVPHCQGDNNFCICSGLHYDSRWIATAAHCVEGFGTKKNPRVVAGIERLANGVWRIGLSQPNEQAPANATIYFYRKGYSSNSGNAYGHAEDIAIIGLDKKDKMISLLDEKIKETDPQSAIYTGLRKKVNHIRKIKKHFLQMPLDDYHFMTFSPESARAELANRTAKTYWFRLAPYAKPDQRELPKIFTFTYKGIPLNNDHTVQWVGQEEGGMSGTPFIINGFVVGFGSGGGSTALLTDDFTAFLKRSMGADYKKGLCVRAVANEEAITERNEP